MRMSINQWAATFLMPAYITKMPDANIPAHMMISKTANGNVGVCA